jgi:hypothetical protein
MRSLFIVLVVTGLCFGSLRADLNGDRRVDFQDFSILASEWMCDMGDYALKFNGIDQYAVVPHAASLNVGTGNFSISFRAKLPASSTAVDYILAKREAAGGIGWSIYYTALTRTFGMSIVDTDYHQRVISKAATTADVWHSVIFTVDRDGSGYCYIDGIKGSPTLEMSIADKSLDRPEDLIIGVEPSARSAWLTGGIDDIRIYKDYGAVSGELTQVEVDEIVNGGAGRKYAALATGKVASWASDCDLGVDVNTLYDAVGTVHGTLTGNIDNNMWEVGGTPFALNSSFDFEGWD